MVQLVTTGKNVMNYVSVSNRPQKAFEVFQEIHKNEFPDTLCDTYLLHNNKLQPVEFYGKFTKRSFLEKMPLFTICTLSSLH